MGIHRIEDIDVERADLHIRTVVVQDDVKHTAHAVEAGHLALDLREQLGGDLGAQQLVDGRSEHLDTRLDDDQGDEGTQDAVERNAPEQHHTG